MREGTIFNVMQFLCLERVTGTLSISFGRQLPTVVIYFVAGSVTTAEFGGLVGDAVLDMLLCQEYAVKEISFTPGRISQVNEQATVLKAVSLSAVMLRVSKEVDKCEARPFIYGMIPLQSADNRKTDSLLQMMYDFQQWQGFLQTVPPGGSDRKAPLPQCVLMHRALSRGGLIYQTAFVALRSFKPLLEIVHPLSDKESDNLRGYMRSLLPHPRATHMSIERFYAFASAIESIAQRRSSEVGDRARRAIHQLIQNATKMSETLNV